MGTGIVVCLTAGCTEQGIAKQLLAGVGLLPGERVLCGACMEPCAQPADDQE